MLEFIGLSDFCVFFLFFSGQAQIHTQVYMLMSYPEMI